MDALAQEIALSPHARYRPHKRRQPERFVDLLVLLLAALSQPLLVRMLAGFNPHVALYAPSLIFVVFICLIRPDPAMPIMTMIAIYGVELPRVALGHHVGPSIVEALGEGKLHLLGVPVAALALGYATVLARRTLPLWSSHIKTNLRILVRRPRIFVRRYRMPLTVLLIGVLLDTVTTMRNLYTFGPEAEFHPAIRTAVEEYGISLGVPVGSLVRIGFVIFAAALWRKTCGMLLYVCGVLYLLASISNYFLLL